MRPAVSLVLALSLFSAFADSNPEVVPVKCDRTRVDYDCLGVTPPSAGVAVGEASASNFVFRLEGVSGGSELKSRTEVHYGGSPCLEPKRLGDVTVALPAKTGWIAVSGGVTNRGSGTVAEIARSNGVCRATCEFEVGVEPSICPAPPPVVRSVSAVFADAVEIETGERVCCVSTNHSPHVFAMGGCECPVMRIEPSSPAAVVSQTCDGAIVLGVSGYEGALAIAETSCGAASNAFDVVEIDNFAVSGLCGCRPATARRGDSVPALAETLVEGGAGFSMALDVIPRKWKTDARWRVDGNGWMPREGSFATGVQTVFASPPFADASISAWFDCEADGEPAADEPVLRAVGAIARLGGLKAVGDATRWLRDEATGLVTNKVYADGKGPTYTYTPDGKLATRTWARGIVTTYSYDDNGALTGRKVMD